MRPYVIIKAAVSFNGCLDDETPKRRIFSNEQDLAAVDELRASCDAILVGAGTVRKDNPRLLLRSDELRRARINKNLIPDPWKVTLTASGNLDPASNFFLAGKTKKLVYASSISAPSAMQKLGPGTEVVAVGEKRTAVTEMLADLHKRGVRRLLVEGGSIMLERFLSQGLLDEFRLAISGDVISSAGAACLRLNSAIALTPSLLKVTRLGELCVLNYIFAGRADSSGCPA